MANNIITNLKGKIQNLPTQKKMMLSYFVIILFSTVSIGGVSTIMAVKNLETKINQMASQLAYYVAQNIDYRSSDFEENVNQLVLSNEYQSLARNNQSERTDREELLDTEILSSELNKKSLSINKLEQVTIFMNNGTVFVWVKGNPKVSVINSYDRNVQYLTELMKDIQENKKTSKWSQFSDSEVLFVKKVVDTRTLNNLGYAVFKVSSDYFQLNIPYEKPLIDLNNIVVLDDKEKEIILNTNALAAKLVDYVVIQKNNKNFLDNKYFYYESNRYLMVNVEVKSARMHIMCFISLSEVDREIMVMLIITLFIGLLCIAGAFLLAWIISSVITKKIRQLAESMKKLEEGQLDVRIVPTSYDELGMLFIKFNQMVIQINELIHNVTQERLLRQAKEYEILQAQIDPHFLYNTLGSIRCMAQMNHQIEIDKMLGSLVGILRMALGSKGKNCRLSEELTCVENYIVLQKIRYNGTFSVTYDIEEITEDLYIVGFILQPIVENAIYHGLKNMDEKSMICISSRIQNENLVLRVEDNGIGMDEKTIGRVLNHKTEPRTGFHSIGVQNVEERIKYYYGEKYGLRIYSTPDKGTTVEITLPVIKENEL